MDEKNIGKVVKLLEDAKQPKSDFVKLMDSFKNPYLVLIACISVSYTHLTLPTSDLV